MYLCLKFIRLWQTVLKIYIKNRSKHHFSQVSTTIDPDFLQGFQIMECQDTKVRLPLNPIRILNDSAISSKFNIWFKMDHVKHHDYFLQRCTVFLNGKYLGEAISFLNKQARYNAARIILDHLKSLKSSLTLPESSEDCIIDNPSSSFSSGEESFKKTLQSPDLSSQTNVNHIVKFITLGKWIKNIFENVFKVIFDQQLKLDEKLSDGEIVQLIEEGCNCNNLDLRCESKSLSDNMEIIFVCRLFCEEILLCSVESESEYVSKIKACRLCIKKLTKPYLKIEKNQDDYLEILAADCPFKEGEIVTKSYNQKHQQLEKKENYMKSISLNPQIVENFIVIEYCSHIQADNSLRILQESATFNKIPVEYTFEDLESNKCKRCILFLGKEAVGTFDGATEQEAKIYAATSIIKELKSFRPTVKLGNNAKDQESDSSDIQKHIITTKFPSEIQDLLKKFVVNQDKEILIVPADFSQNTRNAIVKFAEEHNLKHITLGEDKDCLTIVGQ